MSPRPARGQVQSRYSTDYFCGEYLRAYGVSGADYDPTGFERRYRPLLDLMAARAGGRGRLLEIGSGAGFFLKEAEKAGWSVVGTEIMDAAIEFATKQLGLDVRRGTAEELSLGGPPFDAVVLLDVIEHLYEPRRALAAIRAALRPGGLLVLSTPNFRSLCRVMLGSDWAVLSPAEHLFYFTHTSLDRLLADEGYARIEHLVPQPGFGPVETLNPAHAFHPGSSRARACAALMSRLGPVTYRWVQRAGRADALLVVAERALDGDSTS